MIRYLNFFSKKNKLNYKNYQNSKNILLCDRGRPAQIYFNSIFALHINRKKKMNISVLSEKKDKNEFNKKFYETFGIKRFTYITIKNFNFLFLQSVFTTLISIIKLNTSGFDKFVDSFSIRKIYCGDLIWDTFVRNDHSFKDPKINTKLIKIIFITVYKIFFLEKFIKKNNIKIILTSSNNYSSISALALRLGLKHKLLTFYQKFYQVSKIQKFEQLYISPFHLNKENLLKKYKYKNDNIFEKNFTDRMNAKSYSLRDGKSKDIITAYKNKINNEKEFFKTIKRNKDDYKNVFLYAPHAFSDCNHSLGKLIFRDFFQNFKRTIDLIKNDNKNLWIIRPHPASESYNEQNIIKDYLNNEKKINLVLCPKNISTGLLLKISNKIVTSRGTIGLESACLGKRAILTGRSDYSHLGVSYVSSSKRQYEKMLLSSVNPKKLSEEKIKIAKKFLYWFYKDTMYNYLNIIPSTWTEKNSFMKNLVRLSKKNNFQKKLNVYFQYLDSII